jgi:hypothetical protein
MKKLQTMRGWLTSFAFINFLVFGFILIETKSSDIPGRRNTPALQISTYFKPETLTPAVSDSMLCACTQRRSPQA